MDIPKKFKHSVKTQLEMFFPKNMPESFVDSFCEIIISRTKNELQHTDTYNEARFKDYLTKGTKLSFTPNGIILLIKAIELLEGRKVFQHSPKYQKAREIFDLIPTLLALKKTTGIEYYAYLRNDPDFELIPNIGLNKYFVKEFPKYEFMYISNFETSKWNIKNPLPELVSFIVKKKFYKLYGNNVGLIFHLAITSRTLSAKKLSDSLSTVTTKNPYASIWMTVLTSSIVNKEDIGFVRLLPTYGSLVIKHADQLKLMY